MRHPRIPDAREPNSGAISVGPGGCSRFGSWDTCNLNKWDPPGRDLDVAAFSTQDLVSTHSRDKVSKTARPCPLHSHPLLSISLIWATS
jgi:hypothetical protein